MQQPPHILAIITGRTPPAVINVITPLSALQAAESIDAEIRLQHEVTPQDVAAADVIVLCRIFTPVFRPIVELALTLGIPIIYDLDDHLLGAPKGSITDQLFQTPGRRETLEWMLRVSNRVRVHSPVLGEVVREYNPNVEVVWAPINWILIPPQLPTLSTEPLHIVYAAQAETGELMYQYMRDDLHAILDKYGSRIHLHFMGYTPPDLCGNPLVSCHPFESDYAAFFSQFTRFGYAIGLAPMLDDLFHNSKTNIKFRDYAAAGAAGIYADTPLYRGNGVTDGETGLLVSGEPGSWAAALTRLIENPELIESIRQKARHYVEQRYDMDTVKRTWMADFASLPPRPPMSDAQREQVKNTQWSFAFRGGINPETPWVASLINLLRKILPVRWKISLFDRLYILKKRLRM